MIFEADGVKAGGGESWIPVCLPGFNSTGYLYMYVSFIDLNDESGGVITDDDTPKDESVAIVLISADKESFFQLQEMRNKLVEVCIGFSHHFYESLTNTVINSKCAKAEA